MTLTVQDFKTVFKRPWEVLIGVVAQFIIMPFVAWALVRLFALPPELAIGVILVGTCPGGTASNVISYLAKGDVALSVSMTMSTTLLAPIVTPTLTWFLAGAWIHVSFVSMMISIAEMVLVPVLLGLAAHHFFASRVEKVLPAMPVISVVTIVILVGCVVSLSASRLFDVGLLMAAIVILHNVFGLAWATVWPNYSASIRVNPGPWPSKWGCRIPVWLPPWLSYISTRQRLSPALSSAYGTTFPVHRGQFLLAPR